MAIDNFRVTDNVFSTSRRQVTVTPHDTNPLDEVPKALYIGGAGNITLRGINSPSDVVFQNVAAGSYLLVQPSYIRATGTTATGIIGLS